MARVGYWNHNVHYQPVILGAVPQVRAAARSSVPVAAIRLPDA